MGRDRFKHIRRPTPGEVNGKIRMDCDCGWRGELPASPFAHDSLDALFIAHVPIAERRIYLLVDQRESSITKPGTVVLDEHGEIIAAEYLALGNWIMPEGSPCMVTGWYEDDGDYRARVREFHRGAAEIDILVGEVRTADGRVIGCT